jgi:prevent-host-death family protein
MTIVIGARQARQQFADLLGKVGYGGETAIIERSGKPMVAMIAVETYERLLSERQERFSIIDCIRDRQDKFSPEEINEDIALAIADIRGNLEKSRS